MKSVKLKKIMFSLFAIGIAAQAQAWWPFAQKKGLLSRVSSSVSGAAHGAYKRVKPMTVDVAKKYPKTTAVLGTIATAAAGYGLYNYVNKNQEEQTQEREDNASQEESEEAQENGQETQAQEPSWREWACSYVPSIQTVKETAKNTVQSKYGKYALGGAATVAAVGAGYGLYKLGAPSLIKAVAKAAPSVALAMPGVVTAAPGTIKKACKTGYKKTVDFVRRHPRLAKFAAVAIPIAGVAAYGAQRTTINREQLIEQLTEAINADLQAIQTDSVTITRKSVFYQTVQELFEALGDILEKNEFAHLRRLQIEFSGVYTKVRFSRFGGEEEDTIWRQARFSRREEEDTIWRQARFSRFGGEEEDTIWRQQLDEKIEEVSRFLSQLAENVGE